jgi:hypothetical protein
MGAGAEAMAGAFHYRIFQEKMVNNRFSAGKKPSAISLFMRQRDIKRSGVEICVFL